MENSGIFKTMKRQWNILITEIMTGWHEEQWNFRTEKTVEHSDHWIMSGWHGEQWDFQNNEKTVEHSDH